VATSVSYIHIIAQIKYIMQELSEDLWVFV